MDAKSEKPSRTEKIDLEGIRAINEGRYKEGIATLMRNKATRAYFTSILLDNNLDQVVADFPRDFVANGAESPFDKIDSEELRRALTDVLFSIVTILAADEKIKSDARNKA